MHMIFVTSRKINMKVGGRGEECDVWGKRGGAPGNFSKILRRNFPEIVGDGRER